VGTAVYPGSFDPVTNGHLDIIGRGARIFDRLVVAVAVNFEKRGLFTVPERVEMLRTHTAGLANVEVDSFEGLVVDYVRRRGARVILRGIRTVSDFEYEFQMALTNRSFGDIETVFVMPSQEYAYLSARLIKEVAALGGDVGHLVPPDVAEALAERLKQRPDSAGSPMPD
jgi:pantetheine-phosphate adenylyltransferase